MEHSIGKSMSFNNPVFTSYLFYCSLLVLKVLMMVPLTARWRFSKKVFANPEDTKLSPKSQVKFDDPDVERVRRAHLNDLENIPVFFVAAYTYLLTNPNPWLAITLMRSFVLARFAHTLVYAVVVVPQPARFLAFMVGYGITAYMAVVSALSFCS
ncbi:microsomal glutathione S-transferase 1 [Cimex lectularius]|uniref:Microsomal glutathione S-transferase 1 n=1 Tax=Cimex lectularius TaxID=79782 RepID=A0A8I6R8N6_CIMLE|nr:microsomal glutathione S-transferase 1 [Cimex lectularius]